MFNLDRPTPGSIGRIFSRESIRQFPLTGQRRCFKQKNKKESLLHGITTIIDMVGGRMRTEAGPSHSRLATGNL